MKSFKLFALLLGILQLLAPILDDILKLLNDFKTDD